MKLYECLEKGRAYIIAEMSANHGGSLEQALQIVDAAAESGADCLKTQTYTADTLTIDCHTEAFQIHGGLWDGYNLHDLYKDAYTPWEWMEPIRRRCEERGIDFLSTPFDTTSVDYLEGIGEEFYKIASFELTDIPLIRYTARTGKPIIMSTGMASADEIDDAVEAIRAEGNDRIILLRCCSSYPTVSSNLNLRTIPDMRERYHVPVGLSDHSMGHTAAVAAAALGAAVIEKHFCLSRDIPTADSTFSMEPQEFADMVRAVHDAELAMGNVFYGPTESERDELCCRRSLFIVSDVHKGEELTSDNIRSIRAYNECGIKPKYYDEVLGLKFKNDYAAGTPLKEDCYE